MPKLINLLPTKFDRKNLKCQHFLPTLRSRGSARLQTLNTKNEIYSTALHKILPAIYYRKEKGVYVDLGCGESSDVFGMAKYGYESYGLDLFDLDEKYLNPAQHPIIAKKLYQTMKNAHFIKQDCCENWNIKADVITSNAMLPLINPIEISLFLTQIKKNLKKGGLLSIFYSPLVCGYKIDSDVIKKYLIENNFKILNKEKDYLIIAIKQ